MSENPDGYLPPRAGLPPRGAIGGGTNVGERRCSRLVAGDQKTGTETVCGATPTTHIIWEDTPTGVEQGWACSSHEPEVRELWKPLATHPVGACCGMPGAVWFHEANVCQYQDGLPTEEPVRAVSLPEPVACALEGEDG